MIIKLVMYIVYFVTSEALIEGDQCVKDGVNGICQNLSKCKSAIADINNGINPELCSSDRPTVIVCCLDGDTTEALPLRLSANEDTDPAGTCVDIPLSMTSTKTGQKAFDKCIEYQSKYVYPCERTMALIEGFDRNNHCHHSAAKLIYGGSDAAKYEFPHMVHIGFGDRFSVVKWLCGGILISEEFILTAAHCVTSERIPTDHVFARIGAYKLSDSAERSRVYKVKKIIPHPDYKPPTNYYNDIALLKTESEMVLDQYTVPACIHTGESVDDDQVVATGWGGTATNESSDILQKVTLTKFTDKECRDFYNMKLNYDDRIQTCYGDKVFSKDFCSGDSGGPIQVKSKLIHCMYTVTGVSSLGSRACGLIGVPSIYTRVASFVFWIESIVWPN